MNDLVSVGGICFVAVEPEKVNANPIGPIRPIGPIGKSAETGAETREAGTGKRKYRPRGERTRKEQYRAAWAKWYAEHRAERIAKAKAQREADPEHYKEIQRKYRMKHRKGQREKGKGPA